MLRIDAKLVGNELQNVRRIRNQLREHYKDMRGDLQITCLSKAFTNPSYNAFAINAHGVHFLIHLSNIL